MERYDITIQMLGVEASGPQYVWEKVPAEEGELVLYTDAQATVAALQARVRELEAEGVKLFEWRLALHSLTPGGSEFCTPNACEEWVRKHRASQHEYLIEQIEQRKGLQSQLTQRTAELEAAKAELNTVRRDAGLDCGDHSCLYAMNKTGMRTNGGCRCSPKRMKNDLERSRKAYDDLQAELERVRDQFADLRKMVAALPKVEGAVVVSHGYVKDSTRCHALFGADEDAALYAALLQHRQGMEG